MAFNKVWSVTIFGIILFGCVCALPKNTGAKNTREEKRTNEEFFDFTTPLPPAPVCYKRFEYSSIGTSLKNSLRITRNNDSPQNCAELCLKIHDDLDEDRKCRAFDYNVRTGTCRFFEKTAQQDESIRRVDSSKTHVYELDESCWQSRNEPPPPTMPPHVPACQRGEKPLMERVGGFYLKASGLAFKRVPQKQCIEECLKDQLPPSAQHSSTYNYKCLSVSYNDENQNCVYLNQIARPLNKHGPPLTPDGRYNYFSKMCLPADVVSKCPGYITRFVGKQLVAMTDAKITAKNYGECVKTCLTAESKLGFACRSGMFYNNQASDNCILNYADHYEEHTLFVDESSQEIDYFSLRSCQWEK